MSVTMLALARFTLKGPYQAALVVGLLAVLAVFIPPMSSNTFLGLIAGSVCMMLSCCLVGLVILTQGSVSGLKAIAVSILGITLVAWILFNTPELGLVTGMVQWLPVILLSQTLRSSKSLSLTMLLGVLLGAMAILLQYLVWDEMEAEMIAQAVQRMSQTEQLAPGVIDQSIEWVRLFVLAIVAMGYLTCVVIVLIARWMQASLAESRGFGQEFRALSLGKPAAVAALLLMLLSFWVQQPWIISLMFLMMIAFMFQGIAVIHSKLESHKKARFMLVFYYILLIVLMRQVVALTAITGVLDNWLVFRKKPVKPNDENEL